MSAETEGKSEDLFDTSTQLIRCPCGKEGQLTTRTLSPKTFGYMDIEIEPAIEAPEGWILSIVGKSGEYEGDATDAVLEKTWCSLVCYAAEVEELARERAEKKRAEDALRELTSRCLHCDKPMSHAYIYPKPEGGRRAPIPRVEIPALIAAAVAAHRSVPDSLAIKVITQPHRTICTICRDELFGRKETT